MKKTSIVLPAALFLLLSGLMAGAFSVPVWAPSGTSFVTNSTPNAGTSTNAYSLIAADINGDGKPDLICVGSSGLTSTVNVLTNSGTSLVSNATYAVNYAISSIAAADVNGTAMWIWSVRSPTVSCWC